MSLTSIIILAYNQLVYTQMCIESIRKHTNEHEYEIIVIDNGSTDGTREWLNRQVDIQAIYNATNAGFPKGCNQGIAISRGDILLLNNDVIVTANWLEHLKAALYSDPTVGAVGPVTNNCSNYQAIPVSYNSLEEMQAFARNYNKSDPDRWEERLKLVGYCMFIKREVVAELGDLDERFTPGNYEDDDYSYRILLAGYKLLQCNDTFIHHFGSVSFKENRPKFSELLEINKRKFQEKWGFEPTYSSFVRHEIIGFITDPTDRPLKVLEVGCACGGTLLRIKHQYKNADVFGIELNPQTAAIAATFATVGSYDIEQRIPAYGEHFFDYIILADVLEHLYDPWSALKNLLPLLKVEGSFLISIPNVMHFSVVRDLLGGRWTYQDAGILDRTHVRFFTLEEVKALLNQAGCLHQEFSMTTLPQSDADRAFVEQLTRLRNVQQEQFVAYQYLVKASVRPPVVSQAPTAPRSVFSLLLAELEQQVNPPETNRKIVEYLRTEAPAEQAVVAEVEKNAWNKALVLNILAVVCFENKLFDYSIAMLIRSYELDPGNDEVLYNLGAVLYGLEEYGNALIYFEKMSVKDAQTEQYIANIKQELEG